MRRTCLFGCVLLVLVSCARGAEHTLPPEEVHHRAALAVRELQSARFAVTARFEGEAKPFLTGTADIRADGRLQDGGRQLALSADLDARSRGDGGTEQALAAEAEILIAGQNELYVRLHRLGGDALAPVVGPEELKPFLNVWWSLPGPESTAADVTPDPALLRAQAEVVAVTRDRGVTTVDGAPVYHYDTALDRAKLLQYVTAVAQERGESFDAEAFERGWGEVEAEGELWIDAETFFVRRLTWTFRSLPDREQSFTVTLAVDLLDHNAAEPIVPPPDARPFEPSAEALLEPLMTLPGVDAALPPSAADGR